MSGFVGGIKWVGITVAMLLLTSLLGGCVTLTEQGAVLGGAVLIRPVVDTRVPSPEVVEALEEIEAETGQACVDINEADAEQLQLLRHVGPVRAQQIIGLRTEHPFASVQDLTRVSGLGDIRVRMIAEQGLVCD